MKIVLALVAVCVAVAQASQICRTFSGKVLDMYSGTRELMQFPCKYNAVRRTQCGDWRVTITPGNVLDPKKGNYLVRTLWVGVENIKTKKGWEGRSTVTIARRFLKEKKPKPFNQKDGSLDTSDVFKIETGSNMVTLVEKNKQFRIEFHVYGPAGKKYRISGFKFECLADNFKPTAYPEQICGNGTDDEVDVHQSENKYPGEPEATLFYNIFTNDGLIQTDSDCKSAANAMTKKCKGKQQFQAARLCWPILGQRKFFGHILETLQSPASAFKHCVEFVCSKFKDADSCTALADELNGAPTLPVISKQVMKVCDENLITNDDDKKKN